MLEIPLRGDEVLELDEAELQGSEFEILDILAQEKCKLKVYMDFAVSPALAIAGLQRRPIEHLR